jgi:Protein of unknown function (DUF3618)
MTTTDPDQIRQEIEQTRSELSDDVNALTYKVSPRRMVGQRVGRARGTLRGMKEKVMGTASDVAGTTGDRLSSAASSASDKAAAAPQVLREKAQGSPLAAGLVAFGVGVVISSLLPPTRTEQQVAGQVKETLAEHGDELRQRAAEVGQEVREHLREPAQQAAESVRSTATDAAETVKEQGRQAAQDVRDQTRDATDTVTNR